MDDTVLRRDIERAIAATTDFSESDLTEMDVDELEFISDVLGRTDTDLDTDALHEAITDLKTNNE